MYQQSDSISLKKYFFNKKQSQKDNMYIQDTKSQINKNEKDIIMSKNNKSVGKQLHEKVLEYNKYKNNVFRQGQKSIDQQELLENNKLKNHLPKLNLNLNQKACSDSSKELAMSERVTRAEELKKSNFDDDKSISPYRNIKASLNTNIQYQYSHQKVQSYDNNINNGYVGKKNQYSLNSQSNIFKSKNTYNNQIPDEIHNYSKSKVKKQQKRLESIFCYNKVHNVQEEKLKQLIQHARTVQSKILNISPPKKQSENLRNNGRKLTKPTKLIQNELLNSLQSSYSQKNKIKMKLISCGGQSRENEQRRVSVNIKSVQGSKTYNQDRFVSCLSDDENIKLLGVLDGHGKYGHLVSEYLSKQLVSSEYKRIWSQLLKGREKTLLNIMIDKLEYDLISNKTINTNFSGSTIALLLIDYKQGIMFTINVGDSRIIHITKNKKKEEEVEEGEEEEYKVQELTIDHKPCELLEKLRIMKTGGEIINKRVYVKNERFPGLNMSRSIGDTVAKQAGVISKADINAYRLIRHTYILIATDGLFEFNNNYQSIATHFTKDTFSTFGIDQINSNIVDYAMNEWKLKTNGQQQDDITSILLYFF